jgi:hypothetical protein
MSLRILGGPTPNHSRHLCEDCRYLDRRIGSHLDESRCMRRGGNLIEGRVYTCTLYDSNAYQITGARYKDAWNLVSLPGYGPTFLTPHEYTQYEGEGIWPMRYPEPEDDDNDPRKRRHTRRHRVRLAARPNPPGHVN